MNRMKISTKGRYGIRLMLDLAIHQSQRHVPLKDIARRQVISEKYLEQIVMQLTRAGLVRSARGAQGGYALMRPASSTSVGEILRVLEGSLAPVECVADGEYSCLQAQTCVTTDIWREMMEAVEAVVNNISLSDLVDRYYQKSEPDYVI